MKIALLHPQCRQPGGAIQMGLRTAQTLQNLGHEVIVYTFERSDDCFPELQKGLDTRVWGGAGKKSKFLIKNPLKKLINIITLSWHLRHVDMIIANNPPMQIVAALTKVFSSNVETVWWHHHVPWYLQERKKKREKRIKKVFVSMKSFLERTLIIPRIDHMIATSHFVAERIDLYCSRTATVIHPVLSEELFSLPRPENIGNITLFSHGRLTEGKGFDMLVRVYKKLKEMHSSLDLVIFGSGSLKKYLETEGAKILPFEGMKTFQALLSGVYGSPLGVYCSTIDAFGMSAAESQILGLSTIILDRGGARESIVSDVSTQPVSCLVDDEEGLFCIISDYVQEKVFKKSVSNVNFSRTKDYFLPSRLSSDLLLFMQKIEK